MNIIMLWYNHDWGLYSRRYEMIARTWVTQYPGDRLLIVEPPLNPWIWFRESLAAAKSVDGVMLRYWISNLRLLYSPLHTEHERLRVLRPFLWWPFKSTGSSVWTRFSFSAAWAKVDRFLKDQKWDTPLLWAYPPHAFVRYGAEQLKKGRLCVDLVDDNTQYQSLPNRLRDEYKRTYGEMLNTADVVFSVSAALAHQHSSARKQVIHIPNAVSQHPTPTKRWRLPIFPAGPRVCYVGRLDERLDLPLLKQIVDRLPTVQFIFIGSFAPRTKALWHRPIGTRSNVHLLGTIPSQHIPSVLEEMDVCLIPHLVTPLTESMDPLKLYTYLAAKKPVITTAVSIEPNLKPWVKWFDSAPAFEAVLYELLNQKPSADRPDLSLQGWPQRVATMSSYLK